MPCTKFSLPFTLLLSTGSDSGTDFEVTCSEHSSMPTAEPVEDASVGPQHLACPPAAGRLLAGDLGKTLGLGVYSGGHAPPVFERENLKNRARMGKEIACQARSKQHPAAFLIGKAVCSYGVAVSTSLEMAHELALPKDTSLAHTPDSDGFGGISYEAFQRKAFRSDAEANTARMRCESVSTLCGKDAVLLLYHYDFPLLTAVPSPQPKSGTPRRTADTWE